jgi:predicted anti-sigma-YlaC factor YlaD
MNCAEARRYWSLYYDSEGDAGLHYRIGEHLADCASCAQWFDRQSRLEGLLAEKLRCQRPTVAMWDRVLAQTGLPPAPLAPMRCWSWLVAVAACLLLTVTVSWIFVLPRDKLDACPADRRTLLREEPPPLRNGNGRA